MPEHTQKKKQRAGRLRPLVLALAAAGLALAAMVALGWGMWVLRVLLALFCVAGALLLAPFVVGIRYKDGKARLWVRVLGIRLWLVPLPAWLQKRMARASRPGEEGGEETAPEEEAPREEEDGAARRRAAQAKRLIAAGRAALGVFVRHLRVGNVRLVLPVHRQDAAGTALACGRLQAAIGALRAALDGRLRVRFRQIELIPDFANQYRDALYFTCHIRFVPGIMILVAAVFLKRWLQRRPYGKKVYKRALAEKRARAEKMRGRNAA